MLFLNLKNYPESVGPGLIKLLQAAAEISKTEPKTEVFLAPNQLELVAVHKDFAGVKFCAQHVDNKTLGSTTGWVPAEMIAQLGIGYSIYNHSEHRVWDDNIVTNIKEIQAKGVRLIVCCENEQEAEKLLEAEPFAIAFEVKELIGSGQSISTHRPDSVKNFVNLVKGKSKALIGAGVSTGEDVKAGLDLGAEGFLLASAFVKAEDPVAKLQELLAPYAN